VKFLLDTNVVSELVRPVPDSGVEARFGQHQGASVISVITWHELRFGVARMPASRRRRLLEEFLETVVGVRPPLAYDVRAAEWHAVERARLEAGGRSVPFADGQIAAIAAVNRLVLVTRNTPDFRVIKGLRLERWHTQATG
jgi:tRNA(fMet)-specific endonuclease VapC